MKPRQELQHGSITPLYGENIFGSGEHWPKTQHHGQLKLSYGKTADSIWHANTKPFKFHPPPIKILHCIDGNNQGGTPIKQNISELAWISFFFLFLPGKYRQVISDSVSTPLIMSDIQFYVRGTPSPDSTSDPHTCATENFHPALH